MAQLINLPAFETVIEFKIMDKTGDALQLTTVFNADSAPMPRHEYIRNGRVILATHEFLADELAKMFPTKAIPTYKMTKVYEISDVDILEVTVEATDEVVGYIRRTPVERPSRGGFYPSTTTHIDWLARYKSGKYMTFTTRKAALAYITESHYYATN